MTTVSGCAASSIVITLDTSNQAFANIDFSTLYLNLAISNFTQDYSVRNTITVSLPLTTFLASTSNKNLLQNTISLNSLTNFCAPGSSWYWTGLSGIMLGMQPLSPTNTQSNIVVDGSITYTSMSMAYVAFNSNTRALTSLFGNTTLNTIFTQKGFTATCSSSSHTYQNNCMYLMPIGRNMNVALRLMPIILSVPSNIPPLNVTSNTYFILFHVTSFGISGGSGTLESWEKIAIIIVAIIVFIIIVGAIIYVLTRPSKGSITDITLDNNANASDID